MSLLLPMAAFADETLVAPATDQPTATAPASLVPTDAQQPAPAVAEASHCSMRGGCCSGGGKLKWVVFTGVTATVLTAVAVGVAVGVSRQQGSVQVR